MFRNLFARFVTWLIAPVVTKIVAENTAPTATASEVAGAIDLNNLAGFLRKDRHFVSIVAANVEIDTADIDVDPERVADFLDPDDIARRVCVDYDRLVEEVDQDALREKVADALASGFSVSDIASEIEMYDLASHIDWGDCDVDHDAIAESIDASDIARHIDLAALSEHIVEHDAALPALARQLIRMIQSSPVTS